MVLCALCWAVLCCEALRCVALCVCLCVSVCVCVCVVYCGAVWCCVYCGRDEMGMQCCAMSEIMPEDKREKRF